MDSIAKVLAELYRSDTNRSCVVTAREFRLAVQTVGLSFDDPVVQDNIVCVVSSFASKVAQSLPRHSLQTFAERFVRLMTKVCSLRSVAS